MLVLFASERQYLSRGGVCVCVWVCVPIRRGVLYVVSEGGRGGTGDRHRVGGERREGERDWEKERGYRLSE